MLVSPPRASNQKIGLPIFVQKGSREVWFRGSRTSSSKVSSKVALVQQINQKWQQSGPTAEGLKGSFERKLSRGASKGRFAGKDEMEGPEGRSEEKV